MPPDHLNSSWIQNYFFVDLPSTDPNYVYRNKRRDKEHQLSGLLKVSLVTVDPLFIGSGFQELENGQFVKQTLTEGGRPIIPGSALKGTVRQICRAVSHSCVPNGSCKINLPEKTLRQCKTEKQAESDHACIVCDMFGKMGWSSKVFFSDLIAENGKTERFYAAHPFAPHPDSKKYLDKNGYHRYKFYKTKINEVTELKKDQLRAVPPKTVFTGEITYRDLDKEELGLLLFGLGQTQKISLKLGGYRNEGFGTVNITLVSEQISDMLELTNEYIDSVDDDLYYNGIEALEDGMPYKT